MKYITRLDESLMMFIKLDRLATPIRVRISLCAGKRFEIHPVVQEDLFIMTGFGIICIRPCGFTALISVIC